MKYQNVIDIHAVYAGTTASSPTSEYLYNRTSVHVSDSKVFTPSLATRGADFGDGSVYITYRNVENTNLEFPNLRVLTSSHSK